LQAISVLIRLLWSVTIGLPFFALGLILFLIFDIFNPKSDSGYKILNKMFKLGSLGVFKGVRINMEQDHYDINVEKKR
jgi:hypothetical protein